MQLHRVNLPNVLGETPCPRSYHASCVIADKLYIHGGVDSNKKVLSDLLSFDVLSKTWSKITQGPEKTSSQSTFKIEGIQCEIPALSHHCALSYKERCIVLIGGWNGRRRTAEVFVFDVADAMCYKLKLIGDIPVGLSSHTANFVSENLIIIIGREGGVRTQRRTGNAFSLNLETGEYKSEGYHVDSRSGHTCNLVKYGKERGYTLLVYGGRKTGQQYNTVGKWGRKLNKNRDVHGNFAENLSALIGTQSSIDTPEGRQNCKSLCIGDRFVLIYGGETWKLRDSVSRDAFVFDCDDFKWYQLPISENLPRLAGFSLDVASDGKCYIFGGFDGRHCNNNLWNLELSSTNAAYKPLILTSAIQYQ